MIVTGEARRQTLYLVFAGMASGFSAISFHYAWSKTLPPLFSSRCVADIWVTVVLLLSIVLGSLYFSRRLQVIHSKARLFPLMQVGLGVTGILAWQVLRTMGGLPPALQSIGVTSKTAIMALGGLVLLCILSIPGFLLSGILSYGLYTLPVRDGNRLHIGHFAAFLFLGCAVAALAQPLLLAPAAGLRACCLVGTAVLVGTGLIGLSPWRTEADAHHGDAVLTKGARGKADRLILTAAFGGYVFCALVCVILGTRIMFLAVGHTAAASSVAVAVFFAGLCIGSVISVGLLRRRINPLVWLGSAAGLSGLFWLVMCRYGSSLPLAFLAMARSNPLTWTGLLSTYFMMSDVVLLGPGILLGSTLAFAAGVARGSAEADVPHVARGTSVMAISALLAFLAGCGLPSPDLGFRALLILLPWISIACGIVTLAAARTTRIHKLFPGVSILVVAMITGTTVPKWNRGFATAGVYAMPDTFASMENLRSLLASADVVFYEESREATVSVERTPDAQIVKADGTVMVGTGYGNVPERLSAHIPLLMHPEPRKVFLLGLGTGVRLQSVEAYPVEEIKCTEVLPALARAARLLAPHNLNTLADSRLALVHSDPGHELLLSGESYDVILLGSPVPYTYASTEVLTSDFFELVRSRLSAGGIACQAISTVDLSLESFRSVAKTFATFFPSVTVWWIGADKILLMGSMVPTRFDSQAIAERMDRGSVREDLARLSMTDPLGILACYVMGREKLMEVAGGAPLNTRDRNRLAYNWPRRSLERNRSDLLTAIDMAGVSPITFAATADDDSPEYKLLRDRLSRCKRARRLYISSMVAVSDGRLRQALALLGEAASGCAENGILLLRMADYYMVWSRSQLAQGRLDDAVNSARRAVELNPESPSTFYNLAVIELNRDASTAALLLMKAIDLNPYYVPAYLLKAQAELSLGKPEDAGETAGRALSLEPFNLMAHHLRGLSLIQRQMYEDGRAELDVVLKAQPENTDVMEAVAYSWLLEEELDHAEHLYRRILKIDPQHLSALNNYATVLAEKGAYEKAIEVWTRALELSPGNSNIEDNIEDAREAMRE